MLTSSSIRARLARQQAVIGTWLQIPSADTAELIGNLGYDYAAVDLEHAAFSRQSLADVFRALELTGTVPFARVAQAAMKDIKTALDAGARGLIFPMIEHRDQLDDAIAWSLYPGGAEYTHGKRGVGFSRANTWGLHFSEHTHPHGEGQSLVLIAQIEHVAALQQLDAIFSHPRLDAYMIGPYDFSASMGLTGQFDHPDFMAALAHIEAKALAHNVPKGYHVVQPDPAVLQEKIEQGYSFLAYGIDALFLTQGKCPRL